MLPPQLWSQVWKSFLVDFAAQRKCCGYFEWKSGQCTIIIISDTVACTFQTWWRNREKKLGSFPFSRQLNFCNSCDRTNSLRYLKKTLHPHRKKNSVLMKNLMKPRPLLLFVQRIKEPTAAAGQRIQRETHTHSI